MFQRIFCKRFTKTHTDEDFKGFIGFDESSVVFQVSDNADVLQTQVLVQKR